MKLLRNAVERQRDLEIRCRSPSGPRTGAAARRSSLPGTARAAASTSSRRARACRTSRRNGARPAGCRSWPHRRARGARRRAALAGSADRSGCDRRACRTWNRRRNVSARERRANSTARGCARSGFRRKMKVEASVARCLRTPPAGAYPVRTLSIGLTNRLRGLCNRSIVVVGNYGLARYVGAISGKSTSFTPSSILFRPRRYARSPT